MNYGLARIIKEPLYQALRNTMYIIIGAFALTIYSMFVVNDKGAHSALAVGMLFSQCIIYIGGYVIVLFMICYTSNGHFLNYCVSSRSLNSWFNGS